MFQATLPRDIAEQVLRVPEVVAVVPCPRATGAAADGEAPLEIHVRARRDRPLPVVAAAIQAVLAESGHRITVRLDPVDEIVEWPL
ncbi:hypothetical protein HDA32_005516 [Spinactinospora alkalitolerans]|uniref:Uncharacterized protein n=1 Tax=Spinactinospora alkalitolerans TaxID=687207 RepID=A0A852U0N3_9ACTN|nr:hypothetical protein [Spinactinospora alkalitolerans]NYE50396.1 hypothetical protein [Spinactinospora alkalitolerans]